MDRDQNGFFLERFIGSFVNLVKILFDGLLVKDRLQVCVDKEDLNAIRDGLSISF